MSVCIITPDDKIEISKEYFLSKREVLAHSEKNCKFIFVFSQKQKSWHSLNFIHI